MQWMLPRRVYRSSRSAKRFVEYSPGQSRIHFCKEWRQVNGHLIISRPDTKILQPAPRRQGRTRRWFIHPRPLENPPVVISHGRAACIRMSIFVGLAPERCPAPLYHRRVQPGGAEGWSGHAPPQEQRHCLTQKDLIHCIPWSHSFQSMEILHDSTKYPPSDDPVQLDTSWSTWHVYIKVPGAMAKYKRKMFNRTTKLAWRQRIVRNIRLQLKGNIMKNNADIKKELPYSEWDWIAS